MSKYFSKPFELNNGNVKIELDLSNYAAKTYLKAATGVDISNLTTNPDLVSLKAEVDKIDRDKLKTFPVDLSKLSNVIDHDVVKKNLYMINFSLRLTLLLQRNCSENAI